MSAAEEFEIELCNKLPNSFTAYEAGEECDDVKQTVPRRVP